jgi:hypothetical protein
MAFDEYLKGSGATASVKRILLATRTKLEREGIDEWSTLTSEQLYKWTKRAAFVKMECNLYRAGPNIKRKTPRLIQGAPPEFVCLVGPWFAALQKKIKRDWNINNFITYTSSISNLKLANKLVRFNGRLAEDDVSMWDASVGLGLCQLEARMTRRWFKAPPAVAALVDANIFTHGKTMNGIKYKVRGTRKSGDPYTSLYNSVLNALLHVWLLAVHNRWSYHRCSQRITMFVQGDDNAMSVRNGTYPDVARGMRDLGFDAKFILRSSYVQLEYCSMRITRVKEGYTFGPKIGRIFAKTGYFINPPLNVSRESIVRGTMLGLVQSCHHLAPLMSLIQANLRLCGDAKPYRIRQEEWKTIGVMCTATTETMADLHEQYFWSRAMQNRLDHTLQRVTSLDDSIDTPLVRLLCDVDTSAPKLLL